MIRACQTDLQQFLTYLRDANCRIAAGDITRADVEEFLAHLVGQGLSSAMRARKLAAIREFFRFLQGNGLVEKDPTRAVGTPKKEQGGRMALGRDEYTKLLFLADANPRDYAILPLFSQTGSRVSELCALTRSAIDFETRTMHIGRRTRASTWLPDRFIERLSTSTILPWYLPHCSHSRQSGRESPMRCHKGRF